MRKANAYLSFVGLFLSGCAIDPLPDFDNAFSTNGDDKVIAFVGRKIAISEVLGDRVREEGDELIIKMDAEFKARYEILELVHGNYEKRTIDFTALDHYGTPSFSKVPVAMIYLVESGGHLFHWKYTWDKVYRTKSGRYAACGDPYASLREQELSRIDRPILTPIEFDPPVVLKVSDYALSDNDRRELPARRIEQIDRFVSEYFKAPDFEIVGDDATCKMGLYPDALFEITAETDIYWNLRRDACEEKLGIESFYKLESPEDEAVTTCAAELKSRGVLR